eukprot:CAMPEP_0201596848 /NCGR_PEP_ID=MMETSP0190_2-20130828/193441_1 /ASSEMBLY_ACC=CAM_ASM_000263 /TAXON_ID=37353 /ORGANISM="Rosalina sp." /LENGTH=203 /DNA_ID=CAMNT_0048057429 /DNA_START=71 /DNA_END=682 /DNA_ORIENTATION=+
MAEEAKPDTLDVEKKEADKSMSVMSDDGAKSDDAISFSMNVKHTIAKLKDEKSRKIMVAVDNSIYSQKAIDWVNSDLLRDDDALLLVAIWEEAMVNKLVKELDSEVIHPKIDSSHSKHQQFNNTFEKAACLKDHKNLTALLVESTARINTKTIGEELCDYAEKIGIDILVCGTRGLGGIKKAFLGSVSSYVSSNCKCTCIIVK